ncbi:AAA family ATPase [Candidatus Nomurabacteria bacterium]|nr:AAA family ATPase [Candidatus Nomurabacteria bacterium]
MITKFPRGSEWRKWDLHVHTPLSIIQNYGGNTDDAWNNFIQKIASLPQEIKVIAITDYLFCDGYEHLLTRRDEIPNIELIIPNIEFRLNTFSGTANNTKRHNFHVLFDPTVEVQDIKDQLLNGLSTGYKIQDGTEWQQTPTVRSLEELGKQVKAAAPEGNSIHSKSNLEVGFDNITYKREDIDSLLDKNCFKGRYVTAIGYSEWDQSRWDQSAAEKRNLINSAHFSLTSLDDPAKIEENSKDLAENKLNSLVLHSSDAHNLDRVGKTQLWIKADPTFAGLKQVLNEPIARVFIGDTPPNFKPDHKIIDEITIKESNGWFEPNFKLKLNRDLIAIIGGRGSGKSALAEAIAYGAGSKDNSEDAFLRKASKHKHSINGTKIELKWGDEQTTEFEVGKLTNDQGLVRYLPQGAVEELCSHLNSDKLQSQIENVIFQKLDDTERMGASNFSELRKRILSNYKFEKEQIAEDIRETNSNINEIALVLKSLPKKEEKLKLQNAELAKLKKSLPKLPEKDKKGQEELAKLIEIKKKYQTKIVELQEKLSKIGDIETKIKIFKSKVSEFKTEISVLIEEFEDISPALLELNFKEEALNRSIESEKDKVKKKLKTLQSGTKKEVSILLEIDENDLVFNNLSDLNKGIEDKQKETRAFETVKLKYQQQKKTILSIESSIKALKGEILEIKTNAAPKKEEFETERMRLYKSYFDLLKDEKNKIEELYKPLQDSLSSGTDTDKKLVFEAKVNYKLETHNKDGLDIIDRSRKGSFRNPESLKSSLTEMWDEFTRQDYSVEVLEDKLYDIINKFETFEEQKILVEDQLRENYTLEDYFNWLFDPSYFEIISSLKFDDTDLYMLSPGQKGIILLILYLKIDEDDYRPLIIDQPEENLDNLSVYKDLIEYFRERKQYRQIIIVTHNPNLVVNTDAEQVIIADYNGRRTPRLQYEFGSLEDQAKKIPDLGVDEFEDGIIEQVCNILEGGETAFSSRKRKYQISTKSRI